MVGSLSVLSLLAVIFLLAFLVESLVEFAFGKIFENFPKISKHKWALMYIAMAVGIIGAFVYEFDLLYLLGQFLGVEIPMTVFGKVITGAAIGRGSNYIHDLVNKYFVKPSVE